jgi:hypothetical protein
MSQYTSSPTIRPDVIRRVTHSSGSISDRMYRLIQAMWKYRWIYLIMTPTLLYFLVFKYIPLYNAQIALLVLALATILTACAPAATPTTASAGQPVAPTQAAPTVVPTKTSVPSTTVATEKPVDIELWAQPSVTEQGPPPADWIAYKIVREKLNVNLKVVLTPTRRITTIYSE